MVVVMVWPSVVSGLPLVCRWVSWGGGGRQCGVGSRADCRMSSMMVVVEVDGGGDGVAVLCLWAAALSACFQLHVEAR